MRRYRCSLVFVSLFPGSLSAQSEPEREFCRDADFANLCPGEDCPCVGDTLEIVFEGQLESSIYEYDVFDPQEIIRSRVVLDTLSDQARGFSFGVAFDTEDINPLPGPPGLNFDGGPQMEDPPTAVRCTDSGFAVCARLVVGDGVSQGLVVSLVMSLSEPVVLPLGRNVLLNANYRLERDVGPEGTLLRFSDALGDPPMRTLLTVDQLAFPDMVEGDEGNCIDGVDNDFDGLVDRDDPDCVIRTGVSRVPRTLVDAVVRRRVARAPFRRGDSDGNGAVEIADAVRLIEVLVGVAPPAFRCDPALDANDDGRLDVADAVTVVEHAARGGPPLAAPFAQCGEDRSFDQLVCFESSCP